MTKNVLEEIEILILLPLRGFVRRMAAHPVLALPFLEATDLGALEGEKIADEGLAELLAEQGRAFQCGKRLGQRFRQRRKVRVCLDEVRVVCGQGGGGARNAVRTEGARQGRPNLLPGGRAAGRTWIIHA